MKICKSCGVPKPLSDFHKKKDNKGGLQSDCKLCRKVNELENNKAYQQSDRRKDLLLKWRYGISKQELDKMYIEQKGKCAICGDFKSSYNKRDGLYVDHCHSTNVVRGLLCNHCNSVIGMAKENVTILLKAIEYLVKKKG